MSVDKLEKRVVKALEYGMSCNARNDRKEGKRCTLPEDRAKPGQKLYTGKFRDSTNHDDPLKVYYRLSVLSCIKETNLNHVKQTQVG